MEILKEIIRPGTYTYIHPKTGKPEKFVATPERIRYFHDQGKAMLAAKLSVPVPLEHQPDAMPLTEAQVAANNLANNAGWTKDYQIGEVKEKGPDGKEIVVKDVLFGKLDIADPDIYKKLPSTIKFTSPYITSFTDGSGKKWDGVISHVALTTRPRIVEQQPFAADMAAALSILSVTPETPATPENLAKGLTLSRAGLMFQTSSGWKAKYPVAFSLLTGIKLSKEEIDEIEDEEENKEDEEDSRSPLANVGKKEIPEKDVTVCEMIEHLLRVHGFSPPKGMDEETIVRDVYETLMAKLHELTAKKDDEELEQEANRQPIQQKKGPIVQETPAMYASLEEVNKIVDPKEREMAGKMFALDQEYKRRDAEREAQIAKDRKRSEAITLSILANYRAARDERVKRLAAKLPATSREKLTKMAAGAALSLSDEGTVIDSIKEMLDLMEDSVANTPALLSMNVQPRVEPQPDMNGTISNERREQIVNEVLKNSKTKVA